MGGLQPTAIDGAGRHLILTRPPGSVERCRPATAELTGPAHPRGRASNKLQRRCHEPPGAAYTGGFALKPEDQDEDTVAQAKSHWISGLTQRACRVTRSATRTRRHCRAREFVRMVQKYLHCLKQCVTIIQQIYRSYK